MPETHQALTHDLRHMKHAKTQKKQRGWRISTIVLFAILIVGLGILLYPTISDWWNSRVQSRVIAEYEETVDNLADEQYERLLSEAQDYNERLYVTGTERALAKPELVEGYYDTLDVTGTGVMGYITIEKIHVKLPIYHGTSDDVLAVGAGHLEGSSLPVGGINTHSVISAHRGLPSSLLFTDIDQLEVGDTFEITVLSDTLIYEVDNIAIIEPTEFDKLYIEEGQDLCTLMTCTPYGINTHRLLVRGHRIDADDIGRITSDARVVDTTIVALAIGIPLAVIVCVVLLLWSRHQGKKEKEMRNKV